MLRDKLLGTDVFGSCWHFSQGRSKSCQRLRDQLLRLNLQRPRSLAGLWKSRRREPHWHQGRLCELIVIHDIYFLLLMRLIMHNYHTISAIRLKLLHWQCRTRQQKWDVAKTVIIDRNPDVLPSWWLWVFATRSWGKKRGAASWGPYPRLNPQKIARCREGWQVVRW